MIHPVTALEASPKHRREAIAKLVKKLSAVKPQSNSLRQQDNWYLNGVIARAGESKHLPVGKRASVLSISEASSPRSIMRKEVDPTTKVALFLKRTESPRKSPKHRVSFGGDSQQLIKLSKISSEESIKKADKPIILPKPMAALTARAPARVVKIEEPKGEKIYRNSIISKIPPQILKLTVEELLNNNGFEKYMAKRQHIKELM